MGQVGLANQRQRTETEDPELKKEFAASGGNWKAWQKWRGRIPGCFKQEFDGERMIALCSKCYYADDRGRNKEETQLKGDVKEAKRNQLAPFQVSAGWKQRHGNKPRIPNAGWEYGNLRAGEAGAERIL